MSALLSIGTDAARPLRWPSHAQLESLADRLTATLSGWTQAWGLGIARVQSQPAWLAHGANPDTAGNSGAWLALPSPAGDRALAWLRASWASPADGLAQLLFGDRPPVVAPMTGAAASTGPGLAPAVGAEAWQALQRGLIEALTPASSTPAGGGALFASDAPPSSDSRPWSGAVSASVWVDGSAAPALFLHIPASVAAAIAPQRRHAAAQMLAGPLQSLPDAAARHAVRLQARLADVPVTLGELLALQAGDVLLTPHRLAEPLRVWPAQSGDSHAADTAPKRPLATARLAQRDGHMAIVLGPLVAAPAAAVAATLAGRTPFASSPQGFTMSTPTDPLASGARSASADAPGAQWLALPEAADPGPTAAPMALTSNPLLGVKTLLQARVGSAVLSVGELSSARVGQVIRLDREVDGAIDLLLDGQVVARGQLVAVDDFFGVRLTELPLPLTAPGTDARPAASAAGG